MKFSDFFFAYQFNKILQNLLFDSNKVKSFTNVTTAVKYNLPSMDRTENKLN